MVATGHVTTPVHDHDGEYAEPDHGHAGTHAPALVLTPERGARWFVTDDPFNGVFIGQLIIGDRFTYPLGHVSERETYRWDGDSWEFERLLPAVPAAAETMFINHAGLWTPITVNTAGGLQAWATQAPEATHDGRMVDLSGSIEVPLSGSVAAGVTLGTLPAGHWPGYEIRIGVRTAGNGAGNNTLIISTGGLITFGNTLTSTAGTTARLPLDNVRFRRSQP